MNQNEWLDAITKLYPRLHLDERVIHHSNKSDKKKQKVLSWLEKIEEVHNKVAKKKDKHLEQLYKEMYYNLYIIKEENIPDSYYKKQQQIARERGYGNIEITDNMKHELATQIISDQKASLDKWIEYFLYDEESKSYAIWEKYWVFQGLQNLGKYDKEKGTFSKRDNTTTYPFPPVEREAIFTTLNLMEQYLKDKTSPEEIRNALGSSNFKQLYEYSLNQMMHKNDKVNNGTEGRWIKYNQGSNYHILRNSLQGYYTGWCTAAGENFAKSQLEEGDFYVYYTKDNDNQFKVPRIAIRMNGQYEIAEIRGIANDQNMEPEMIPILNKKLEEFPDKDKYLKKEHDMNLLTIIDNKTKNNQSLSKEELRFLYEIDNEIEGFGYRKDPRIEEIIEKRNVRRDISIILNCAEKEIGLSSENDDYKKYRIWVGNLNLSNLRIYKDLNLPEILLGNLQLSNLETAEGLNLSKTINGYLDLGSLKTAEGLNLPETINGNLNLSSLETAEGLNLPKTINGYLDLGSLKTAEGLNLPETINGNLNLSSLETAEGLNLPKTINGYLDLGSLKTAEGLNLPETINGNLNLSSLETAEGLNLPKTINGYLDLKTLKTAEGLNLPKTINGYLDLDSLETAEGLNLPETINGNLILSSLETAEGLNFPQTINGYLDLLSLKTAEGLKLPQTINGDLYLEILKIVEGLKLPQTINGDLRLDSLETAEGLNLPETINGNLNLSSLETAEGLNFPQTINGYLDLKTLKTAEGLNLPKTINGDLYLTSLETAEGLDLSRTTVEGEIEIGSLFNGYQEELEEYLNNYQENNNHKSR